MVFSIIFHLGPQELAMLTLLGLLCGCLAYVLNEVTWRNDAPRRIGFSDEGMHYETVRQRGHVSFADIIRISQRREAAFGLRITDKDSRVIFLSVGVGAGSIAGGALQERYAKWCFKSHGKPPKSSLPHLYGRWLVVITPQ
jgi:hypothetical protein